MVVSLKIRGPVFMSMFNIHWENLRSRRFEKNEEVKVRQKKGCVRGRKEERKGESTQKEQKNNRISLLKEAISSSKNYWSTCIEVCTKNILIRKRVDYIWWGPKSNI